MILTHTLFSSGKQMNPCSELNAAQVLCLDSPMQVVHKSEHLSIIQPAFIFLVQFFCQNAKTFFNGIPHFLKNSSNFEN
jgi:hypothetical protein